MPRLQGVKRRFAHARASRTWQSRNHLGHRGRVCGSHPVRLVPIVGGLRAAFPRCDVPVVHGQHFGVVGPAEMRVDRYPVVGYSGNFHRCSFFLTALALKLAATDGLRTGPGMASTDP